MNGNYGLHSRIKRLEGERSAPETGINISWENMAPEAKVRLIYRAWQIAAQDGTKTTFPPELQSILRQPPDYSNEGPLYQYIVSADGARAIRRLMAPIESER